MSVRSAAKIILLSLRLQVRLYLSFYPHFLFLSLIPVPVCSSFCPLHPPPSSPRAVQQYFIITAKIITLFFLCQPLGVITSPLPPITTKTRLSAHRKKMCACARVCGPWVLVFAKGCVAYKSTVIILSIAKHKSIFIHAHMHDAAPDEWDHVAEPAEHANKGNIYYFYSSICVCKR